eukprot:Amastigsp_a508661_17.p5 type:complete len:146 gc:universal Amastigsp_a508661_17:467-30(-)
MHKNPIAATNAINKARDERVKGVLVRRRLSIANGKTDEAHAALGHRSRFVLDSDEVGFGLWKHGDDNSGPVYALKSIQILVQIPMPVRELGLKSRRVGHVERAELALVKGHIENFRCFVRRVVRRRLCGAGLGGHEGRRILLLRV